MRKQFNRQSGFSLMEILVVVAILVIVLAVVFGAVNTVQKRNFTEQQRVDITQNAREFLDQLARDMHNTGYPNARMYSAAPNYANNNIARSGLIAASATDVVFEGDMDGSGTVTTIRYTLQNNGGSCPCTLRRSAMYRTNGTDALTFAQNPTYSAQVQNVVNSIGGTNAWSISGTLPNGTSNNTYYSTFKQDALFQYFDANGNAIAVPSDLTGGFNTSTATTVKTVLVTLNVLAPYADKDTGVRPAVTMRATIKLPNL
jgi:prepilin-type N-terminal cleavage/methylation domain-containing protein